MDPYPRFKDGKSSKHSKSPVSSSLSFKSDQSMDHKIDFKDGKSSQQSKSPVPSCLSFKSDQSMHNPIINFKDGKSSQSSDNSEQEATVTGDKLQKKIQDFLINIFDLMYTQWHTRIYTALQALEMLNAMYDCESDGGEELTFAEADDSDTELRLDEDTSMSDEEQCSPSRKKHLEAENNAPAPSVKAKDGTVWETAGAERVREKAGPTEHAKWRITSRLQSFLCLFNIEMLRTITDCTVHEARRTNASWSLCQ